MLLKTCQKSSARHGLGLVNPALERRMELADPKVLSYSVFSDFNNPHSIQGLKAL